MRTSLKTLLQPAPSELRQEDAILSTTVLGNERASSVPVIVGIACTKVAVLLTVLMAWRLFPFAVQNFRVNFVDPAYRTLTVQTAYSTWDAQHFLFLSEGGYHPGQPSNGFFPLFPGLIHLLTPVVRNSVAAGLVISNLASLLGLYVLFRLVEDLYSRQIAEHTLLLYLAFPAALFFSLIYSESLYLLLAALFFYFLYRNQFLLAALPATLLPLDRPTGVLILVPFATYYLVEVVGLGHSIVGLKRVLALNLPTASDVKGKLKQLLAPKGLLTLTPLLGLVIYLWFMYVSTGDALEITKHEASNVSQFSLAHILEPGLVIRQLFQWPLSVHGFTNSILDRAVFVAFLLLVIPLFRRVHIAMALYALAVGTVSVLGGSFMSYTRYVLLAFPVFIVAAILLQQRRLVFLWAPLLFLLVLVQGLLVTRQALNYWVA